MSYIILILILTMVMFGYIRMAKGAGIIDEPNDRSSHTKPTVRGGGVIFPVAIVCWAFLFDHTDWYFVSAVLLMGGIGFLDDRYNLSQLPRILVQSVGVLLVLFEMGILSLPVLYAGMAFILVTGWLNTFNFMDGINGISVLYALSVLTGVYLFSDRIPEVPFSLIFSAALSLIIFGWLNVRKKALAFAGDVGSLSMGLILAYFVSSLILSTGRWEFILFLSVYGVDSVLTILHRLIKKENIFEAHRSHLYQYLANEMNTHHILVSAVYAFIQLNIILAMYAIDDKYWTAYFVITLLILSAAYIAARRLVIKKVERLESSKLEAESSK